MTLTVVIPSEVFAQATRPGNDLTLRLVIDEGAPTKTDPEPVGPPRGPLAALMERGDLKPGDRLYWHRPRLGRRFVATVLASGELEVDGVRYQSPSDAATACAGSSANGWTAWRRESDGTVIDKLR
jgi:hypothetical protein